MRLFFILLGYLWLDLFLDSGDHLIENTHHDGQTLYGNGYMNTQYCGSYFWILYEVHFELHSSASITNNPIRWDNLACGESLCDLIIAKEDGSLVVQLESWIWTLKPLNNKFV